MEKNSITLIIPEIRLSYGLAGDELLLYSLILAVTGYSNENECRLTMADFAKWLGKTTHTVRRVIRSLEARGFISITNIVGESCSIKLL